MTGEADAQRRPTSLADGIAEANGKIERHEAAIAELITMFGDFTHTVTDGTLDEEARLELADAALERTRARFERVTELEKSLLPGFLAELFLALDAKHGQAVMELDQLNRTVDIERVASRLRTTSGDKVQAALDRRAWEQTRTKSESAKHSNDAMNAPKRKVKEWAIGEYRIRPIAKGWNPRSAAQALEPEIRARAAAHGWKMSADETIRRETIAKWFREFEHERNPSYGKRIKPPA